MSEKQINLTTLVKEYKYVGICQLTNKYGYPYGYGVFLKKSRLLVIERDFTLSDAHIFANSLNSLGDRLASSKKDLYGDRKILNNIAIITYQFMKGTAIDHQSPTPEALETAKRVVEKAIADQPIEF